MHHDYIDQLAQGSTPVHRIDARAKLLALVAYSAVVISFGRYDIAALAPLCLGPAAMLVLGEAPIAWALKRVLLLGAFVAVFCLAAPLYDRAPRTVAIGPWAWHVSGGWLVAGGIWCKFALGLLAVMAVMATTPMPRLLEAMRRLRMPRGLVAVIGLVYRYLFVMVDQAVHIRRARDFRLAHLAPWPRRLAGAGGAIGGLFVRTLDRAQRVHLAMVSRGYGGQVRNLWTLKWRTADTIFLVGSLLYLAVCRVGAGVVLR